MKTGILIALVLLIFLLNSCKNKANRYEIDLLERKQQTNINSELSENFELIHDFLKKEMTKSNTDFYKIDGYEISLNDQTIVLVKNGSLLSKINKETGVIALPMKASDNEKSKKEADQIVLKLIELAK